MAGARQIKKQMKKNQQAGAPAEKESTLGLTADMADPNTEGKVSPAKVRQLEDMTALFMQMIHGEDTKDSVLKTLSSQPDPEKAINATTNMLMSRVDQQMRSRKQKFPNDVKVATTQYIVSDLAQLGNAAQVWDRQVDQEELPQILQSTMQTYIEKGLKDKTIDPIELQKEAEGLMNPEQLNLGNTLAKEGGIPSEPTATMAAQQYAQQQVDKEAQKTAQARNQTQAVKSALGGPGQAPPQQ